VRIRRKRAHCESTTLEAEWVTDRTTNAKHPLVKLHNEILDFTNYAVPKGEEIRNRELAIKNVTVIVKKHWPSSEVRLFGSFATDLSLATSDIDLVFFLLIYSVLQ